MTKLPRLTGRRVIAALKRAGATSVPVHAGETIGPGLFSKILRDCEMSEPDFRALLD